MRIFFCSCIFVFLVSAAFGQSPEPPLADTRLSIHTLVREDIFAGWRSDNMERHARGEKNIDELLKLRPAAKADLLAWKGGATLYRAVLAHEANESEKFRRYMRKSLGLFAEARELGPKSAGVAAVSGGSYVVFADRLPEEYRATAWSDAYDNYQVLWRQQAAVVDKLPVHIRGELLAGLAQSAQRTGRQKEFDEHLDKILEVLPGTSYERVAKRWKDDPQLATTSRITCKTCHAAGRLAARIAKNDGK